MRGKPEKYTALAQNLFAMVRHLPAGSSVPGIQVLARELKVNFKTVNKAVRVLIDQGALHRVRGRGTFVTQQAAAKGSHRRWVGRVGLMFPNSGNPSFLQFAQELNTICWHRGYALASSDAMNTRGVELSFLDAFQRSGGKLLLRFPNILPAEEDLLQRAAAMGLHVVLVNDFWANGHGRPHVAVDEAAGIELALSHLQSLGHRRIAFLDTPEELRHGALRAYRKFTAEKGLCADQELVILDASCERRAARIAELHKTPARVDAAVSLYDGDAIDTMMELWRLRIRVPGDISLVGFDDIAFASDPGVQLTTVQQPMRELAAAALDLLLSGENRQVLVSPRLVVRKTTAAVTAGDAQQQTALTRGTCI